MRAGIPDLWGAACRRHAEVFDVAGRHDAQAIKAAKAICSACPVLRACRAWLVGLPRSARPCGVVAGRYLSPPRLPPAADPRPRATVAAGSGRGLVARLSGGARPGDVDGGVGGCGFGGFLPLHVA